VDSNADFSIDYVLAGRTGKVALTIRCGGAAAKVFKVDILDEAAREKAQGNIHKEFPGLDTPEGAAALSARLLEIAGSVTADIAAKKDGSPTREAVPEKRSSADLLAEMPQAIRNEAAVFLADPNLVERVLDDIEAMGVAGERELTGTIYLAGTSRLLDKPASMIVQGPSSSGKSHAIDKTSCLFPPEAVIHATQMTPQALFHMKSGELKHKFIVAGERSSLMGEEAAEATRALREMQSAGRLSKLMPVKEDGSIVTARIEQEGPIAYVESTTQSKIFAEDANRSLLLQTDEQPSQTRRIVDRLAADCQGEVRAAAVEGIIQRHHALQRLLQPKIIVIPFARRLGNSFPTERVEVRRAFQQVLSMIQAITLLHQFQRAQDEQGRLIAVMEDYQLARHLLAKPMARLLGRTLTEAARRCYERIRARAADSFTTRDVIQKEKTSDRAVRGWLSEMHDAGLLEQVEAPRGRLPAKWCWGKTTLEEVDRECSHLPTVESVFPEMDFRLSDKAQLQPLNVFTPEAAFFAGNVHQGEEPVVGSCRQKAQLPA
jgi:hypothetical protein